MGLDHPPGRVELWHQHQQVVGEASRPHCRDASPDVIAEQPPGIGLVLYLVALPANLFAGPTEVTGPAAFGVVVVVVAVLAYFAWFLVFLWSNRSDPALGAQRGVPTRPGPLGA